MITDIINQLKAEVNNSNFYDYQDAITDFLDNYEKDMMAKFKEEQCNRFKKLLDGDVETISSFKNDDYGDFLETSIDTLNEDITNTKPVRGCLQVEMDTLWRIRSVVKMQYKDMIPVIEEHYGVKFVNEGRKYFYFTKVA